jgi:hypothetical protein
VATASIAAKGFSWSIIGGYAIMLALVLIGWKIIPVGLLAITASFLLSTVIAEFALGLWH